MYTFKQKATLHKRFTAEKLILSRGNNLPDAQNFIVIYALNILVKM